MVSKFLFSNKWKIDIVIDFVLVLILTLLLVLLMKTIGTDIAIEIEHVKQLTLVLPLAFTKKNIEIGIAIAWLEKNGIAIFIDIF